MPRGRTLLVVIAVLAWAAVAAWNALKPLPPGTHVASLATRLTESQVQIVALSAAGSDIEARELAAIDRASELIVLDAAPLSRAVGRGLLLQRTKRPNIKIVLVSDPRSEAYGGTPVEYLESLERAGVIVARVHPALLGAVAPHHRMVERPVRRAPRRAGPARIAPRAQSQGGSAPAARCRRRRRRLGEHFVGRPGWGSRRADHGRSRARHRRERDQDRRVVERR